jgi:4-hydroxy-tetrahydrodipicolinate reductase
MTPLRLAVIGDGRMGQAVAALAPERGFAVVTRFGAAGDAGGRPVGPASLAGVDVAIEFTVPDAAPANIAACLAAGVPVVVGTTGWHEHVDAVAAEVRARGGALLHAPNFSAGVVLFTDLVREAAARLARVPGMALHLVDVHHAAKRDAPSGTARALAAAASAAAGRDVPVTSIRTGHVPGTHALVADAPFEQITLTHEARDRRVFADGALTAAAWLVGRRGVFTMRHVLDLDPLPT